MPGVLVPIVEGQSEERAIGLLLRRILSDLDVHDLKIARPFRVKRNRVVRPGELERAIAQVIASRSGTTAILVLLDSDDDCPAVLGQELIERSARVTEVPVKVVLPKTETEAWILAAVESVRGQRGISQDAQAPSDPEAIRNAKSALSARMTGVRGYLATDDQPALLSVLDLNLVAQRSPSFAKLQRDIASLMR